MTYAFSTYKPCNAQTLTYKDEYVHFLRKIVEDNTQKDEIFRHKFSK